jgi:hypothetical protein
LLLVMYWAATFAWGADDVADVPTSQLQTRVQMYARPRGWPERVTVERPSVPVTRANSIVLDGNLDEAVWHIAKAGPPPLPLSYGRPVDKRWGMTALHTPVGLAIAMRGLSAEHSIFLLVDPDGTQRGWTLVEIDDGVVRWSTCGPPHPLPSSVVTKALRNISWGCVDNDPTGVVGQFSDDGLELLVPWAALGRTTEHMKLLWSFTGADKTGGTWDPYGGRPHYSAAGRGIEIVGSTRSTAGWVTTDLEHDTQQFTLQAKGLNSAESWRWEITFDGVILERGQMVLEPNATGMASAVVPVDERPLDGTIVMAWRDEIEPLRPGAEGRFYHMKFWTSLSTPVFQDELVLSFQLRDPAAGLPIEIVDNATSEVIATGVVDLPAGAGRLYIDAPAEWPDRLRVRAGTLLHEGDALAVRRGTSKGAR